MATTVTEIAKQARVSISLVSRLLNGDKALRISDSTEKRILEVRDRLGGLSQKRNNLALRKKLTRNIVLPVNRVFIGEFAENMIDSPSFNPSLIIKGLEESLSAKGFRLSVTFFENKKKLEEFKGYIAWAGYCDGIILLSGIVDEALANMLLKNKVPHISLYRTAERFGVNTVCAHSISGTRKAVSHLMQQGHKKIGYIGTIIRHRNEVNKQVIAESNLEPGTEINITDDKIGDLSEIKRIFCCYLEEGLCDTAFICQNDTVAFGVIDAMKEKGLLPGKDISLIGYDNIEARGKDYPHPILTTIDLGTRAVAKRAGEVLLNQILGGQNQIVHESLPVVELIVRETTGRCPE